MPYAPARYCQAPACPHKAVRNGRCQAHSREAEQQRGSSTARGYDYAWSQYSKGFLIAHPLCGEQADGTLRSTYSRCLQQGYEVASECVDHIIPMRQGGSKWETSNHQALCRACNTWKDNTFERAQATG